MKRKKYYIAPQSRTVRLASRLTDNSYDPGGESGLVDLSGNEVDAGMGQVAPHPGLDEDEPKGLTDKPSLWER